MFVPNEEQLDRRFLSWFIKTPAFREQVEAQGSTNYAAIRPGDVLGYEIPLPPLAERQRIVARIKELAAHIHEAQTLRQQVVEEAEALFESTVGARFSLLDGQPSKPLGHLASKIGSGATPLGGRAAYPASGVPFIVIYSI